MKTLAFVLVMTAAGQALAQQQLHFTYMWHLEQPIYWPDRQSTGADRYERAWETIQRLDAGAPHPQDNLRAIFGLDDRVAVYQYRVRDSISAISGAPEAGAQVSYSGGLIENITSLGGANQLGYSPSWSAPYQSARGWSTNTTGVNKPRLDVVLFSFHHALLPLLDDSAVRKELQLYKRIYGDAWGGGAPMSGGLFPSEMAFSTRLIPILASEGIRWSFVSAEKISRACSNFPVVFGSGGVNCDPPNRADMINPAQSYYHRVAISRGCAPAEAAPFSFTPHRAQFINPSTGAASEIVVVPCSQSLGWKDGYAPLGLGDFNALQAYNDPTRPMLAVLSHDGDNAWGGGYSYYLEATPNLVNQARAAGYVPTVVEKYLADHPVPANDIVHVEQGAWVNADGCFGSPQFLNWNWPPITAGGQIDIENGWHVDIRNWAVITAAQNYVDTAEQITGATRIEKILYPDATTTATERAWHYFLGGLNSGFMYYGNALDMEIKPTVTCNRAIALTQSIVTNTTNDQTPPSLWTTQRHPWNPGSINFGPQYGYQQRQDSGDFTVWSFVYDVSGPVTSTLKYRIDGDGVNPLTSVQNETFAGGTEVGSWISLPMTRRAFPAGNVYNDPSIDFYVSPTAIADQVSARIVGVRNALVDYYIEAVDSRGNVRRGEIQHVYVGAGSTSGGGNQPTVSLTPATPIAGQNVTITYNPANRPLSGAASVRAHIGYNNWTNVVSPDPVMTASAGVFTHTFQVPVDANQLDLVFNNGAGVWDNNGGQDWHFTVTGGTPIDRWDMDGVRDTDSTLVASRGTMQLFAGIKGDTLYVATNDAGEGNDHFIFVSGTPGPLVPAPWAKSGRVATWSCFLADENTNDYEGWFDTTAAPAAMTGPNGGVLEGTIDLRAEFGGSLPDRIALAVGVYANNDGGSLVTTLQTPAPLTINGDIESGEFVVVRICDIGGGPCCVGDYNRDGGVDGDDVIAFFGAWDSGSIVADINSDASVDGDDVIVFFASWDSGCP